MLPRRSHHKGFSPRRTRLHPGKVKLAREGSYRDSTLKARPYHSLDTRKGVKAELDRVTSLLVRARDGRCVTCGTTANLTCSHYFKRRFLATRWNLTNCNAQCARCNELHNRVPWPYRRYMVGIVGESGLDELFELRNSAWRPSDDELRALLDSYRQLLREMRKAA